MNYPYGVHIAVAKVDRETGGVDDRALSRRLRRRPRGQSDAGRGPDRRRLRAGARRRAARGVPLRRARRAAVGQFRRLPDADRARGAAARRAHHRGCAEPAQSARPEGRGRGRRQRGRRRHRGRDRRRDRHSGRDHAAAGDAAAAAREHSLRSETRAAESVVGACDLANHTDRKLRCAATSPARSAMRPCHCNWPFSST